jgi:hypothetical protein
MNERIKQLLNQAGIYQPDRFDAIDGSNQMEKFAKLIVQQCIDKIETYRIPVGNSSSGELACEWTYAALKEIRDDIKESFGITDA